MPRTITRPASRSAAAVVLVALVGLLAGGCTGGESAGNAVSQVAPTPTAKVERGADTGNPSVDLEVKLYYRVGAVRPDHLTVPVQRGDRVDVVISSDTAEPIAVTGHPGLRGNVSATEPEHVRFTIEAPTTRVLIAKETVATFLVHSSG